MLASGRRDAGIRVVRSPAETVQEQLEAYNAKDVDRLLATYASDAELYEHPSKLLAKGATALRERFTARFEEPNLWANLLNRMVAGNVVVDHEEVTRTFPEGPGKVSMVMIYEVQGETITKAWAISRRIE